MTFNELATRALEALTETEKNLTAPAVLSPETFQEIQAEAAEIGQLCRSLLIDSICNAHEGMSKKELSALVFAAQKYPDLNVYPLDGATKADLMQFLDNLQWDIANGVIQ